MSIINKIFDKIYVINLDKDKYKKNMIIKKFKLLNIKFEFFNAINGFDEPHISKYNEYKSKPCSWNGAHRYEKIRNKKMIRSPGAYGYLVTWVEILKIAISNKYKKILVFDDDVIFHKNFETEIRLFFNSINKSFKIVSLGVSQHIWSKIIKKHRYYNPIEFTDGSFAVGLDSTIFNELLNDSLKFNISFDSGPIRNIYIKYKHECFIAYPNLVIADLCSSSISEKRSMKLYSNKFNWNLDNFNYIPYCSVLVSIILTSYNAENTIELAIESIIKQTYNNIELIIVDDCSTDNTLMKINQIINKYDKFNIKLIELKKNMGCYCAKNIGIRFCKGEIIGFQDADDISLSNRIEIQAKEIIENDYEIVGSEIIRCSNQITNLDNLSNNIKNELNKSRFGLITLLFKKEVFKNNGFYRDYYPHSMDQEFIERVYFNKMGKLSDIHCHTLLSDGDYPNYKKINVILYLCQPMKSNNISCIYNKGNKKYIRENYLKDIENKNPINYIVSFKLIKLIQENFGNIIINDEIELNYLKYFLNSSSSIVLEINPIKETNNYILLTKLDYFKFNSNSIKVYTTNADIYDKFICKPKFYKIFESYKEKADKDKNGKNILAKILKKKNCNIYNFVEENQIKQIIISKALPNIKLDLNVSFSYNNNNQNTLFYGIYSYKDYFKVKNHKGKKWILWSGNDCNPKYNKRYHIVLSINDLKIEKNLSLSNLVNEHFNKMKISYYNLNENKFNNYKLDFIPIENKTFVFIIASYNNEAYYLKNLNSVLNQTYKNWKIIYIDDCSTDQTYNLVNSFVEEHDLKNKFNLIKNTKNMKQAYSRYQCYKYCDDQDIICFLDGDDWLYDNYVLEKLNNEYNEDIKITYGSYYKFENNKLTNFVKAVKYKDKVIDFGSYRERKGWFGIPLRTGYAKIYKEMPESYLYDSDGNWMSACTDVAEFLWAIEKSLRKFKVIEYPTYVYNIDASKRFENSTFNLSKKQLAYRQKTSKKIFKSNI